MVAHNQEIHEVYYQHTEDDSKLVTQKNIDKMAAELEKRDDVAINSVTKRDPKTRKVVKRCV